MMIVIYVQYQINKEVNQQLIQEKETIYIIFKMETEQTLAQKALTFIEPINRNEFITSKYSDEKSKCCVLGHINRLSNDPTDYSLFNCYDGSLERQLRQSSKRFLSEKHKIYDVDIANVNNDPIYNGYKQKGIKARVVNLLKDMIKAGY